jgi:hypothetical protein
MGETEVVPTTVIDPSIGSFGELVGAGTSFK